MSSPNLQTRTKILQATWDQLEKHGGQGVRMSDIAKAAGISRQAVYLHFESRAKLLAATTLYLDEVLGLQERLAKARAAQSGPARLDATIDFWGNYMPEICGVAQALIAVQESDEAAAAAWANRMNALRDECALVIDLLKRDHVLATDWTARKATDALWTLLAIGNWLQLTQRCGWTNAQYISRTQLIARNTFVA